MDAQWLEAQFRINPGKSKAELARALGLEAPAVSKVLAGIRQIKAHEYVGMRKFFDLPVDGEQAVSFGTSYVLKPLNNKELEERVRTDHEGDNAWVMPASLLKAHTEAEPEQIKIFAIQENAMVPDFMPGEQVLVDLSDKRPSPPGVFVVSDGLGYIIRQCSYVPHSQPPEIKLSSIDTKYDSCTLPLEKTEIIGRVIAKLQWL